MVFPRLLDFLSSAFFNTIASFIPFFFLHVISKNQNPLSDVNFPSNTYI